MISLDQVYLLEQKVESAVEKIQQLQAENDALRSKCTELTNALSAKSEQLSSFESDQSQIENGIKKALDRLNSIESSVLKTASQKNQDLQVAPQQEAPSFDTMNTIEAAPVTPATPVTETVTNTEPATENIPEEEFNSEDSIDATIEEEAIEDDNHDGLGFDIF